MYVQKSKYTRNVSFVRVLTVLCLCLCLCLYAYHRFGSVRISEIRNRTDFRFSAHPYYNQRSYRCWRWHRPLPAVKERNCIRCNRRTGEVAVEPPWRPGNADTTHTRHHHSGTVPFSVLTYTGWPIQYSFNKAWQNAIYTLVIRNITIQFRSKTTWITGQNLCHINISQSDSADNGHGFIFLHLSQPDPPIHLPNPSHSRLRTLWPNPTQLYMYIHRVSKNCANLFFALCLSNMNRF